MLGEELLYLAYAVAVADERRRHDVYALVDAKQQVGAILLGDGRKGELSTGRVDGFAFAQHAIVQRDALDVEPHGA